MNIITIELICVGLKISVKYINQNVTDSISIFKET